MTDKSKLLWRCRRGVKELDVLFTRFVEQQYDGLSDQNKAAFDRLLEIEDPVILGYFLYNDQPEDSEIERVVRLINENPLKV